MAMMMIMMIRLRELGHARMVRTTTDGDGRYYYLTPTTLVRLHHHGHRVAGHALVPVVAVEYRTPNRRTPKYCKNKSRK